MKKPILILLVLFGFFGLAQAQSSSIGLRLSASLLFNVVYTYNFEAPNRGFSARAYLGATLLPNGNGATGAVGGGLEGIYRAPIGGLSSVYFGLGTSAVYVSNGTPNPNSSFPNTYFGGLVYFLAGVEVGLGESLAFSFDIQPLNYAITPFFSNLSTIPLFALSLSYRF